MKSPASFFSMLTAVFCLLVLLCVAFGTTACLRLPKVPDPFPPQPGSPKAEEEVLAIETDTNNPMAAFEKRVNELLLANDFKTIEAEANAARKTKERFRAGFWKIDSVYNSASTFYAEYPGQKVSDEMWESRIELLQSWKAKFPDSVTARVSLAQAYMNYAWYARGSGFADTVSEKDRKSMQERLNLAELELLETGKLSMYCPAIYANLLFVGTANGWPKNRFEAIFDEAARKEPNYIPLYLAKAENLKEKWHGEPGEWQKFVDSLPEKLAAVGSDEVNIIYFAVVADKLDDHTFANNWAMISKDRIKKGFADMEKKFTPSKYRLNQLAYISCITMDLETAKWAFDQIGDERNEAVWKEKTFNMMKQLAERGTESFRK